MKKIILSMLLILFSFSVNAISFKTERIEKEYRKLETKNKTLTNVLGKIDALYTISGRTSLYITEVFRTKKEQKDIYGNNKKVSPHELWDAVDIRTNDLSVEQVKILKKDITDLFNIFGNNIYKITAIYHDVGLGPHIHIQFRRKK